MAQSPTLFSFLFSLLVLAWDIYLLDKHKPLPLDLTNSIMLEDNQIGVKEEGVGKEVSTAIFIINFLREAVWLTSLKSSLHEYDSAVTPEEDVAKHKALVWKQDLRIVPLSAGIYLLCYLDRSNIGQTSQRSFVVFLEYRFLTYLRKRKDFKLIDQEWSSHRDQYDKLPVHVSQSRSQSEMKLNMSIALPWWSF